MAPAKGGAGIAPGISRVSGVSSRTLTTRSPDTTPFASLREYLAKSCSGLNVFLRYVKKITRLPGVNSPARVNLAPNHITIATATAICKSSVRPNPADRRLACIPSVKLRSFSAKKLSANACSSDRACTTLIVPMLSAATAAIASSRSRCLRETSVIKRVRRDAEIQNRGKAANAARPSFQVEPQHEARHAEHDED